MLEDIKNIRNKNSDFRSFGITIGIILILIAAFLLWKGKDLSQAFFISGFILCLFGVAIPIILKPVYWISMIFATILGWVMTRVILSLLFYLIFTPIGLILRLFGKKLLELSWKEENSTYWNYRTDKPEKEDYEKQF